MKRRNNRTAAKSDAVRRRAFEMQVLKTIRKNAMLESGQHVLAGVSGGADSMALLLSLHHLAPALHLTLTIAHLNHRIRGVEADEDENFVRETAKRLGLPFVSEAVDVRRRAASEKRNLEETARQVRYEFLHRTAARLGAHKIAVGHSLNDQAETTLMRLFRGSGADGLSGIRPVAGMVVRPLLESSRSDILRYLDLNGTPYREDSTNKDAERRRNRIRLELMPYLEQSFNPRMLETLAREAEIARDTADYLAGQSLKAYENLRTPLPDGVSIPAAGIRKLHPALRSLVIRRALQDCLGSLTGIGARHIGSILLLCRPGCSGRRISLPKRATASRQFENIILRKDALHQSPRFRYELQIPGCCIVPEIEMEFRAAKASDPTGSFSSNDSSRALLNPELLPPVLVIRSRLEGDRYGGPPHRKVKKMLIDARIPLPARSRLPMIAAGNAVVWIPGFEPAKSFRAKADSGQYVSVEARACKPRS